jgi:beta-glucosidase
VSEPIDRPWTDQRRSPEERARLVLAAMTDDEKYSWVSGDMMIPMPDGPELPSEAIGSAAYYPAIERIGIPAVQQSDASLGVSNLGGVRPGDNATALPSSLLLGATFDVETARETGALVGRQARAKGFAVQLAGGANLVREATGGRNFEYVSEDPLLTGEIAGASVAGIQSQGVVSTMKHFAVNAQETGRVMADSVIDEAALRESDLLAFRIGIERGCPGAIMPGYNLVNGHYATENAHLITDVLKGEWGFTGWVMADWGATHSTVAAANAGLDVQSGANLDPEPFFGQPLRDAVADGSVPQERLDDMVFRQLRTLFALGIVDAAPAPGGPIDYAADDHIAQRAAERGLVLLRNEGNLLPLRQDLDRILVIGQHADQGVLAGGGSSAVTPVGSLVLSGADVMGLDTPKVYHPSSPVHAIRAESGAAHVDFLDGTDRDAAVAAARDADAVVLIVDEWRSEGLDAAGLRLPDGQEDLIAALAGTTDRLVVVVESGGPVALPWADDVPAVIAAFYPGSGGGPALAGVLFGRVNPSGHLPVTFPESTAQLPRPEQKDPATTTSNPGEPRKGDIFTVDYDIEGSDVGYRWFDRESHTPGFPFGHGLSYTTFAFSDLDVHVEGVTVTVDVTVTNTGARAGAAVPQVYVGRSSDADDPDDFVARLVGFARVELAVAERRSVRFELDPRFLARWDASTGDFRIAGGDEYCLRVGADAADTSGPSAPLALATRHVSG